LDEAVVDYRDPIAVADDGTGGRAVVTPPASMITIVRSQVLKRPLFPWSGRRDLCYIPSPSGG
jgi:hypothetical protein